MRAHPLSHPPPPGASSEWAVVFPLVFSMQVLEKSLTNWSQNAKELDAQTVELTQFILTEDMMVLTEQIERLHSQWEELCLRVSSLFGHADV